MAELTLLERFFCVHREITECDENGDAICLACGSLLTVKLTRRTLERFAEQVLRGSGDRG